MTYRMGVTSQRVFVAIVCAIGSSSPIRAHDLPGVIGTRVGTSQEGPALSETAGRRPESSSTISALLTQAILDELKAGNATTRPAMADAFLPFKDRVKVRWDERWLYVESNGMPAHDMMSGITAWQQQVPLPKDYSGLNAWQIPLHPVASKNPVSIKGRFLRGAIAVAANGIPIFNPQNNRGELSQEIGELDKWGGHCGRGDDYHYHAAPIFLEKTVGPGKPIAFALDGYPIYGTTGPDGAPVDEKSLDVFRGKADAHGNYAYFASTKYPYVNGGFHGEVTEIGGQVDPQPSGRGVRPSLQPLRGAHITGFTESQDGKSFSLKYEVGNETRYVNYVISGQDSVKFEFVDGHGQVTTENYSLRSGGGRANEGQDGARLPQTNEVKLVSGVPNAIQSPFIDNKDGTVTDRFTGLMWQQMDSGESTWEKALANATTLRLGGHDDWRLPTVVEAFSLTNHNINPAIDRNYFPENSNQPAEYWWTSDARGASADRVWVVNRGGGTGAKPKNETLSAGGKFAYNARYVRGPARVATHAYVNNKDGTITDADTGLMWTQTPAAGLDWATAMQYAKNLSLGEHRDWRLPDVKELATLLDHRRLVANEPPLIDRVSFPDAPAGFYWSSTKLRTPSRTEAWYVDFDSGSVRYQSVSLKIPVFAVRTAQPLSSLVVGPNSYFHPEDVLVTDGRGQGDQPNSSGGSARGAGVPTRDPAAGLRLIPRAAEEKLNATEQQRQQIDALEKDVNASLEKILTPNQIRILRESRPPQNKTTSRPEPRESEDSNSPGSAN